MSFAPIGLLSVLTSMIRLCGSPKLWSYFGYEHEPRANAALEMTKANCAGIHAKVIDGTVSRSTTSEATSQAIAVLFLRDDSEATIEESLREIQHCHEFQHEKTVKGCPEAAGSVNWCFRVTCPLPQPESINAISRLVATSLNTGEHTGEQSDLGEVLRVFHRTTTTSSKSRASCCQHKPTTQDVGLAVGPKEAHGDQNGNSVNSKKDSSSFFCTFDGVSEVNTSAPTPAGYFCMTIGVSGAGYMIYSACDSAAMQARPKTTAADWTHGVVLLVKNTNPLDTTGSLLMQAENQKQEFQAVWLKTQGGVRFVLTWVIAIFLTLAFVCYYLGLRSSKWSLSVTQLLVCLLSAFARSVSKMDRGSFDAVQDVRVHNRCYSTTILDMQRATKITVQQRTSKTLDLGIYSTLSSHCLPLTGEFIAWRAAKLCLEPQYQAAGDRILSVTGMRLSLIQATDPLKRHILVEFEGGVVTEEGLAFPNVTVATAFSSSNADPAAPTPLLARGITRQSQEILRSYRSRKGVCL
ncbi:hypothetical protein EDB80DRAFT_675742 [Ilyonectria destructans]|nr:hypothetical protein EDB80DRAFT_675742 [Ilyonectria destructans]